VNSIIPSLRSTLYHSDSILQWKV